MMNFEIRFDDAVSPMLQEIIAEKPQWLGSAMKSAGWWAQRKIKEGISSGAPGVSKYAELIPNWLRSALDKSLGNPSKAYYEHMGKLVNAVGYDASQAAKGIIVVGWLSASAVYVGSKQKLGFITPLTDKMRLAFAAAGVTQSPSKTNIEVPARPTYGPMRNVISIGAPKKVEERLIQYMNGVTERSAKGSKRRYRVYT